MPAHIGIILDGNRRYGQRLGLTDPHAIYSLGARKLDEVLDWCGQLVIPAVTLWVFCTENFERPTEQVSGKRSVISSKLRMLELLCFNQNRQIVWMRYCSTLLDRCEEDDMVICCSMRRRSCALSPVSAKILEAQE
jgi:undecaprenyl diphosphate synthase